jgi:hypothetical protein
MIVCGNGIFYTGKTMFLEYVLVRRLQQKMVTIYCDQPGIAHVFGDDGVRAIDLTSEGRISELGNNSLCCALVNLGDALPHLPLQFYPARRLGRLVVATSPDPKHVECFKEHNCFTYYMPTWNWNDLYCGR